MSAVSSSRAIGRSLPKWLLRRQSARDRQALKTALLAATAGLVGAAAFLLSSTDALEDAELRTVDARFEVRGTSEPPADVVIVAINDVAIGEMPRRYQDWPRWYHARVLRNLARAGAKAVVYDVQFTEPSRDPDWDAALYDAAALSRPVVFGTTETSPGGGTGVFGSTAAESRRNLRTIGASAGQMQMPDDDGTYRRVGYTLNDLKALAVVAAERVSGRPVPAPNGPEGHEWIDFAGPPRTYDTVPFSRVFHRTADTERLRGKVAFVGLVAPTLGDSHPTAASGGPMSGPEIHANAFETARRGFPLQSVSGAVDVLLIGAMAAAIPLLAIWLALLVVVALAVAAAAAFLVGAQLLFDGGVVVPVVVPMLALVAATVLTIVIDYATETRDRRRLGSWLAQYVPERYVDELVTSGRKDLQGVKLTATVLFCDLRSFTPLVERIAPSALLAMLNEYLKQMGQAIEDAGGAIVDYQGDGILAVFGAPKADPRHADNALAAAGAMHELRLKAFNDWLAVQRASGGMFEHLPDELRNDFRMGIGISSGTITSGSVGYAKRMAYGAVGQATVVAVRLEKLTKSEGQPILVADSTKGLMQDDWDRLEPYGTLAVDGIGAVKVWTPAAWWLAELRAKDDAPGTNGRSAERSSGRPRSPAPAPSRGAP